ncbi:nephrocystin-3 protein [Ceratobasidium sp. AG-Ba]|nr:nephrocystin-3 protein [Ceratobasidium sp. AG-Ba]
MSALTRTRRGRRLLAVDGWGPCGMSTIILMEGLMRKVQQELGLSELPRPGDFFDLMAGSGMGGLLIIMWGRLMMSIDESKKYFKCIGDEAFSEKKTTGRSNTQFKTTKLEEAVTKMLMEHLGTANDHMLDSCSPCKTFVCVTLTHTMRAGMGVLLRSYPTNLNSTYGSNCTLSEAIRTTCTSAGQFKPVEIMEPDRTIMTYLDGTIGHSNPTPCLLDEAEAVFPGEEIACLISLGAGQRDIISVPGSSISQSSWNSDMNATYKALATDAERTAEAMEKRFKRIPSFYFRFSVDQGLQHVDLADWNKCIIPHAWAYLRLSDIQSKLDRAGHALVANEGKVIVERAVGSVTPAISNPMLPKCPPSSRTFVGREEALEQMRRYFFNNPPLKQLIFVLHGLGGSGKSQIAYKFVEIYEKRFDEVFYVDATSEETILSHLAMIAVVKKAGETSNDALAWLARQSQNWLLIFNNADFGSRILEKFLPRSSHGKVIVTTRNHGMVALAHGAEADYSVSGMSSDDALKLLLEASQAKGDSTEAGPALVEELGYFALSINQAAAYIRVNECTIQQFRQMNEASRGSLLEKYHIVSSNIGLREQTAHTIWSMCYEQLTPVASKLLKIMAFMHHSNISEEIFRRAAQYLVFVGRDHGQESQDMTISTLRHFIKNDAWEKPIFLQCIEELRSYSFVDFDPHSQCYSMHLLVQRWARGAVQDEELTYSRCVACLLALSSWNFLANDIKSNPAHCRAIAPHIDTLPDTLKHDNSFCASFAGVYLQAGRYKEAELLQKIDLERAKELFGEQDIVTFQSQERLLAIYSAQGRRSEVTEARYRLFQSAHESLGENDLGTMHMKQALALAFIEQDQWVKAESIQKEILAYFTNLWGPANRLTCAARAILARICLGLDNIRETEKLCYVVPKHEIEGDDEYEGLHLYSFPLIQVLMVKEQWDEAAALQEELVSLSSRLYGAGNITTLNAQRLLAVILTRIPRRAKESELLAEKVAKGYSQALGPEHSTTLSAKRNSLVLSSLQVLGHTHTETLRVRRDLGMNLLWQKRWHEASELLDLQDLSLKDEQPTLYHEFLAPFILAEIASKLSTFMRSAMIISYVTGLVG